MQISNETKIISALTKATSKEINVSSMGQTLQNRFIYILHQVGLA